MRHPTRDEWGPFFVYWTRLSPHITPEVDSSSAFPKSLSLSTHTDLYVTLVGVGLSLLEGAMVGPGVEVWARETANG